MSGLKQIIQILIALFLFSPEDIAIVFRLHRNGSMWQADVEYPKVLGILVMMSPSFLSMSGGEGILIRKPILWDKRNLFSSMGEAFLISTEMLRSGCKKENILLENFCG